MRTIAQAITDLATKAKGSQAVPRGRKITDALDALADAMAGTDVPLANCTTIVNAIDVVTANYGGGGGVTLGNVCTVIVETSGDAYPAFYKASIDGALKVSATTTGFNVASGFSLDITVGSETEPTVTATVTKPDETTEAFTDFTVEPDTEYEGDYHITLTVPELPVDDTDPSDPIYSTITFTF